MTDVPGLVPDWDFEVMDYALLVGGLEHDFCFPNELGIVIYSGFIVIDSDVGSDWNMTG